MGTIEIHELLPIPYLLTIFNSPSTVIPMYSAIFVGRAVFTYEDRIMGKDVYHRLFNYGYFSHNSQFK
jgi:hypothetical protein